MAIKPIKGAIFGCRRENSVFNGSSCIATADKFLFPEMDSLEKEKAVSFDRVAELYEKARPSYPAQLAQELLDSAQMPEGGSILEIGCGTGKATVLFAPHGHSITC